MDAPLSLIAAVGILWLTYLTLRGGLASAPGQAQTNLSGNAIILAVLSFGIAGLVFGWQAGIALVLGIAIHEFGHVAAYRVAGHDDARFRLIPLLGGVAISGRLPRDQLTDFYVAIMGPGIMLGILVATGALIPVLASVSPQAASFAVTMFVITGAINFFNLLPLWPLDGGRILRTLTYSWSPLASRFITLGMSIGLAVWALYAGLPLIFLVALLGFSSARRIAVINRAQPPMSPMQSLIAAIAYLAATAAHGLAGWDLITRILLRN